MKCSRIVPINKCHVCGKQWNKNLDLGYIIQCERNKYPNIKLNYVMTEKLIGESTEEIKRLQSLL